MTGLKCIGKFFYEDCGARTTLRKIASDLKRCFAGTLTCPHAKNFSTKCISEEKHHIAIKHTVATARVVHECRTLIKMLTACTFTYNTRERNMMEHRVDEELEMVMLHK